ncbi:MAG: TonB-dependent receptor, partial [Prevotella sp.]|nr:TonB-dependent receptor [Prevotella sp.]
MQKRLLFLVVTLLTLSLTAVAQVTTSGINGRVSADNDNVIGATVTAKHVPSGSVYRAVTNVNGRYTITGMRAGGPYEVEVSYVGYQPKKFTGIQLALGQNIVLDARLNEGTEVLRGIEVLASARNTMRSDRAGAVTNLTMEEIAAVPTVGRSMTDIVKMTPQSSSASGLAIGGGNYRQSNITVDGASFNNVFGMNSTPLPGGGTPISLDAIEQMTVSITPYDVRQSGFIGGGVNAVTKSGTNEFKGSVYTYLTSTSLKGSRVQTTNLPVSDGHNNTYGVSLGGPIIKDKLFFFVNGEKEDNSPTPLTARAGNGKEPWTAVNRRPQLSELQGLSDYMKNTYGLTTGPWQDYNLEAPAYRILARVDWNITDDHKFNVRFTKSNRKSASSASSSRSIGSDRSNMIYSSSETESATGNRNTHGSGSYYNMSSLSSCYYAETRFTSIAAELNSKFGKLNNTLRATYSLQDQPRSTEYNDAAPVVEIVMADGQGNYPSWALTGDVFTYGNLVQTKNTVVTDEVNITLGKHNLFGGVQFEHTYAANGYAQAAAGYYVFEATPEQVSAGRWNEVFSQARFFGMTYGNNEAHSMFTSTMDTNLWSLYLQDNISLTDNFRLSAGVRFELPNYPSLSDNFNQAFYDIKFGDR